MKIAVVGTGHVGGGLAQLWERSGHVITRVDRDGGDVADVDVVLIAVPGAAVASALANLTGLSGKTVIDATNLYGGATPPAGFSSNAEYAKSVTSGPTAKAFNTNFASLLGRLAEARAMPSNLWSGDDQARDVVEQLSRDAGYDPVRIGGLDKAQQQEGLASLMFAIAQAGLGEFVYRMAPLEQL